MLVWKRILNSLEKLLHVDLSPDTLRAVRIDFQPTKQISAYVRLQFLLNRWYLFLKQDC